MALPGTVVAVRLLLVAVSIASALGVAAPAQAAPVVRGVAIDAFLQEDPALAVADVDDAADLGANTVRLAVSWSAYEPARGSVASWYRDRLDAVVARARERGVRVLLTPVFTPAWARSSCGGENAPPDDPADYARHVAGLAQRYGSALAGIEIWNEPNLASFWSTDAPARRYVALLRAAHTAIKAAAPAVPVVAGAVAGGEASFLRELFAEGMNGAYDVLSVHIYNDGRAPDALIDPRFAHATYLQGLRAVRETLDDVGETGPVWITETGWNTSTLRGALWLDGVALDEQADYLARALAMLADPASGVAYPEGVLVYRLRDIGDDPHDPQHNYGLRSRDGGAKPAYAAVREAFAAYDAPAVDPAPAPAPIQESAPTSAEPTVDPVATTPTRTPTTGAPTPPGTVVRIDRVRTAPRLRVAGRVVPVRGTRVRRVEVAVESEARRRRCAVARRSTSVARRCPGLVFRRARGATRWTHERSRLPRGRHVLRVRVLDDTGTWRTARRVLRVR